MPRELKITGMLHKILAFTLAKNATKPNLVEIIPLQTTRKENNLEDRRNVGENSCKSGDGTDQTGPLLDVYDDDDDDVKERSYCCCEHYGTTISFALEKTELYLTLLQPHKNGCHPQITANMPLICLLVNMAENFLHVFIS